MAGLKMLVLSMDTQCQLLQKLTSRTGRFFAAFAFWIHALLDGKVPLFTALQVLTPFYFAFTWYLPLLLCNLFLHPSYPRSLISPPFFTVCFCAFLSFCYTVDALSKRTNNSMWPGVSGSGTIPSADYFYYESLGRFALLHLCHHLNKQMV